MTWKLSLGGTLMVSTIVRYTTEATSLPNPRGFPFKNEIRTSGMDEFSECDDGHGGLTTIRLTSLTCKFPERMSQKTQAPAALNRCQFSVGNGFSTPSPPPAACAKTSKGPMTAS